jgi:hypothetical protein
MIDAEFESIIRKMANEMGKTIFAESKFKAIIKDYTKNEFKKERDLLLDVIDAGCVKYINETKNLAECKQALIKRLEDDYSLSTSKSAEMLDMLILILRGEKAEAQVVIKPLSRDIVAVQPQQPILKNGATPKIGDIIPFGYYKWRVLDVQGDEALIITKDVIEKRPYNIGYLSDATWETCDLRKYLNSEFLQKFTKEQQGLIVERTNHNPDNLWYGTKGGRDTRDKIFLLSIEEVDRYFGDSGDYLNKRRKKYDNGKWIANSDGYEFSNSYDDDRIANYGGGACWWWLRSPGDISRSAALVDIGGGVSVDGSGVDCNGGVRPALWLKV